MKGFSKLTKEEKINFLIEKYFANDRRTKDIITQYWNQNATLQQLHDEISENTISNFYLPYGVAPHFMINKREYTIPMVIEESSVVAAASNAAKYWKERGGFVTNVIGTKKIGQVHFLDRGKKIPTERFSSIKERLIKDTEELTRNMQKRGGGILDIELIDDFKNKIEDYYQLRVSFETRDSMGANFINSCLEQMGKTLKEVVEGTEIIMCILSNYTPECLVRAEVSCPVEDMGFNDVEGKMFAERFLAAVRIAEIDTHRATTHNKGIMNGIDALLLATGNDFRAVEASCHTHACKGGFYSSLSHCEIKEGVFKFWLEIPLSVGTIGGLTALHPLSRLSLEILQNPSAKELMEITAAVGLAQNFAAVKSLTTTGIQKGHMKMHLSNILNQLGVDPREKEQIIRNFKDKTVSIPEVVKELETIRSSK